MTVTYPYGYSDTKLTMDQLQQKDTWKNLHPEFQRRLKAMLEAGQGRLGVGTAWRSSSVQEATFLNRHNVVSGTHCCMYEGKKYLKKSGVAHAAPPGKSFHESTFKGKAAAADMIGDLNWMHQVEFSFGFKDFRGVGNEPWHIQFQELPNSVTQWQAKGSPDPTTWKLPGTPPKPPDPTPPPSGKTYTVVSGDSWYGIAAKVGCTPQELVAANPPATMNTVIHPGQVLNLPGGAAPPAAKSPNGLSPQQNVTDGQKAATPPSSPTIKNTLVHNNSPWLQQVLCSMPQVGTSTPIFPPEWVGEGRVGNEAAVFQKFGDGGRDALAYWQGKNGLTADGVYGPATEKKMRAVRGK